MLNQKNPPYTFKEIEVDKLLLDKSNPRFVEMFENDPAEDDLIIYMLKHERANEIADSILDLGYFHKDEALWVSETKEGKYIVREGNRRLSAVKALAAPEKFFDNKKNQLKLDKLPCLVYTDENALDERIRKRHTEEVIKRWSRLAQAKYAKIMYDKGQTNQNANLLKIASIYSAAQNCGLGKKLYDFMEEANKSAVLERFFAPKDLLKKYCGFHFEKNEVKILNENAFKNFLTKLIEYTNSENLTAKEVFQKNKEEILSQKFGLSALGATSETLSETETNARSSGIKTNNNRSDVPVEDSGKSLPQVGVSSAKSKRGSVQKKPHPKRKRIPPNIIKIINELYDDMDERKTPNAKYAFVRVVFENVLKYVVENTCYSDASGKSILLIDSNCLKYVKPSKGRPYTNFTDLKNKFLEIVNNKGKQNALKKFDLDGMNQIIHNYNTKISDRDVKKECDNLIPIIEFLLQEEADLIASLDTSKF